MVFLYLCAMELLKHVKKVPIYFGRFMVLLSDNQDDIRKYVSDFDDEIIHAHSHWHGLRGWNYFTVILNPKDKENPLTYGTLAHEAFHIAGFIMEKASIDASHNNDEAKAYLIKWVMDEMCRFIIKQGYKIV